MSIYIGAVAMAKSDRKRRAVDDALGVAVAPWARQNGETAQAFEAFAVYLDQEPVKRSLASVGRALGKSKPLMERWSAKHGWVRRARAWDDEREAARRGEELEVRRKMGRRHAQQAQSFERLLMEPAAALAERLRDQSFTNAFRGKIAEMEPADLLALVRACAGVYPSLMRAERLASGESTENIEGRVAVHQVKAVAARIAARAAKYISDDQLPAFLSDLKADLANELGA